MSVQTEISRLQAAKSALRSAIQAKGVTVPASGTLDGYAALVDQISQGTPVETLHPEHLQPGHRHALRPGLPLPGGRRGQFHERHQPAGQPAGHLHDAEKELPVRGHGGPGQCTVASGEVTTILEDAIFMIGGDAEIVITK